MSNSIIKIKRSTGSTPPASLGSGELAYAWDEAGGFANGKLFIGTGAETAGAAANVEVIGGKQYVSMLDHTQGVVVASSALVVDANKKLNELLVDNITVDGNTISTTDTNGNLVLSPNGTGLVSIAGVFTLPRTAGSTGQVLVTNGTDTATWSNLPASSFTLAGNSGTDTFNTGETLTITGSGGITTAVTNNTYTITIANSGVTAGTYPKVTVGSDGRVTAGTSLSAADIPELTMEKLPSAALKHSVKAATTANITLSAPQTIDGIALVAGDRVLVKDQTTPAQNGIYVVQAAAWTRSTDSDTALEIAGAFVNVLSGTVNGGMTFDTDFKSTDTLGTTAVNWYRRVDTFDLATANTANKVVLRDASGNFSAGTITAALSGNATTATTLQTARTINGVSFNGSANITVTANTTNALTIGTGLSGTSFNGSAAVTVALATAYGDTVNPYGSKTANTFLAAPNGAAGAPTFRAIVAADIPVLNQNTTGSAASLTTARTIAISGPITGTATAFNGTANITIPVTALDVGNAAVTGTLAVDHGGTGVTTSTGTGSNVLSDSPALTGTPTAPTAAVGTNTTQLATTAFVAAAVDAARTGLDAKESVRAATTANITLTNTQTVDGVALAVGNRVLVKNQTNGAENGIYIVQSTGWTRATDADDSIKLSSGTFVFVEQGTANADSGWVLSTEDPITVGTTSLTWVQFSGAGQITAGNGLTKTGNTLDVGAGAGIAVAADSISLTGQALALHNLATNGLIARTASGTVAARTTTGTANRITVTNGDGVSGNPTIDIASNYVGQNTITTLGTVTTGTWNGTTIAVANGGTGLTSVAARAVVFGNGTAAMGVTGTSAIDGSFLREDATGNPYWSNVIDGGTY